MKGILINSIEECMMLHKILKNILYWIFLYGMIFFPIGAIAGDTYNKDVPFQKESCCCSQDNLSISQSETNDCCQDKGSLNCSGKCGMNSCQNSIPIFYILNIDKMMTSHPYVELKNLYPPYNEPYSSSGFYSIWQPPKIV